MPPAGVVVAIALLVIGVCALVIRRDLVFKLLALGMVNSSTILLLISLDSRRSTTAPIVPPSAMAAVVDPLPQALVLAAIVINFAILALALVFVMVLAERYHTTDAGRIERAVAQEDER
ncbi:cation:proton antiporter subunit C [Candidatus Bipolaricaulota bacterium]|nr:cation:proton antiporter subunit C [Candidatus Bipolaricaulota bacterium]